MKQLVDLKQGMRDGMRNLASGVCVVSGMNTIGERCAMTASSVTSISDEPPSLLVCVNKSARMDQVLTDSSSFVINVLSSEQQDVSEVCATPDMIEERFEVGKWLRHEASGLYYVDDAPAVFVCDKRTVVDYGTHSIYIGDISEVLISERKQKALVYADGGYHYL